MHFTFSSEYLVVRCKQCHFHFKIVYWTKCIRSWLWLRKNVCLNSLEHSNSKSLMNHFSCREKCRLLWKSWTNIINNIKALLIALVAWIIVCSFAGSTNRSQGFHSRKTFRRKFSVARRLYVTIWDNNMAEICHSIRLDLFLLLQFGRQQNYYFSDSIYIMFLHNCRNEKLESHCHGIQSNQVRDFENKVVLRNYFSEFADHMKATARKIAWKSSFNWMWSYLSIIL